MRPNLDPFFPRGAYAPRCRQYGEIKLFDRGRHYDELPIGRVKSFSFCFFFFVHKEKEGPAARLPGLLIDVVFLR